MSPPKIVVSHVTETRLQPNPRFSSNPETSPCSGRLYYMHNAKNPMVNAAAALQTALAFHSRCRYVTVLQTRAGQAMRSCAVVLLSIRPSLPTMVALNGRDIFDCQVAQWASVVTLTPERSSSFALVGKIAPMESGPRI